MAYSLNQSINPSINQSNWFD